MLQRMLLETVWGRSIFVFTVAGVLLRMITTLSYKRMKKAAENPATTKKQWVQLLKKRYESYERFGKVKNVEVFVEHYFSRKGILGIPLTFWDKSGLFLAVMAGFAGVLGAMAAFQGMVSGNMSEMDALLMEAMAGAGLGGTFIGTPMMGCLLLGGMSMMGLLALHILTDGVHMKRQIVVSLTDYLENGGGKRAVVDSTAEKVSPPAKEDTLALSEAAVTEEERQVLEEVLEEYFW